jgi:predicted nuclease of predicted toxin-antitoxin system
MRIAIDEDIPNELTPLFRGPGLVVEHVEDLGFKGKKNGELLAALSGTCDVLVTGDTNLEHQQNLDNFDIAVVLIHPRRLVIDQITPLVPRVVAAVATAAKHAVTMIGVGTPPPSRAPTSGRVSRAS